MLKYNIHFLAFLLLKFSHLNTWYHCTLPALISIVRSFKKLFLVIRVTSQPNDNNGWIKICYLPVI